MTMPVIKETWTVLKLHDVTGGYPGEIKVGIYTDADNAMEAFLTYHDGLDMIDQYGMAGDDAWKELQAGALHSIDDAVVDLHWYLEEITNDEQM